MLGRLTLAIVGASAITLGMLYAMNAFVEVFEGRDPTRYFRITDVLLRPDDGRPRRIPRAQRQPERADVEIERPDVSLDVERPSVELDDTSTPRVRPGLEEGPSED